ncbi:UNVERIFIED_CONTAM: K(+) efflux antiporter 6 [Sesamum radiatum]|uniref:K(+) efflux antiporter 6 n=2 Tax=Magnoliopsida TaxID=3398 RepID=A0AAW2KZD7_SESRA
MATMAQPQPRPRTYTTWQFLAPIQNNSAASPPIKSFAILHLLNLLQSINNAFSGTTMGTPASTNRDSSNTTTSESGGVESERRNRILSSKLYFDVHASKVPLIYSSSYDIAFLGIEKMHPFDSSKWGRICRFLIAEGLLDKKHIVEPLEAKKEDLLVVHSESYLDSLKSSSIVSIIVEVEFYAVYPEVPPVAVLPNCLVDKHVLYPFRKQVGGTILAAKLAKERGWAINVGGGFHHCSAEKGGGFCAYADISLCIYFAFVRLNISRAGRVYILDMYNPDIYPFDYEARRYINQKVEVASGTTTSEYLSRLDGALEDKSLSPSILDDKCVYVSVRYLLFFSEEIGSYCIALSVKMVNGAAGAFDPELIIYNAGTDVLDGDPLGRLKISPDGIAARDEKVFMFARERDIPLVMLTSDGIPLDITCYRSKACRPWRMVTWTRQPNKPTPAAPILPVPGRARGPPRRAPPARYCQMSRSLATAILISVALLATTTSLVASEDSKLIEEGAVSAANATGIESTGNKTTPKEDTFADMIDRALEKEFTENEDQNQANDAGSFNNSVAEQQAVLETVARVKTKKNETKEEKSFKLHQVFNLDNDNGAEETPTLIDRKDNVFIISNFKSKYPVLQLDLRLISDLVVVIVSATGGGIAFACAGQPVLTGYLLAGSIVGPGGFNVISEMVQVETVAQFGVIFLLFALGLEFSTTKLRVVRAVAVLGGLIQILLFMCLCGIIASLCGGRASEGVFVGAFLSMSSTAVVYKFLMEKNSTSALHGQVTIGTLILQDCAVGLLFALLPVLGGTSGVMQGVMSMTKSLVVLIAFLAVLSILSRTCVPWFLKLMISLSSQTNELYQLASVAFCLLVAWCSDKLGLSLELGSFAAGVMIATTDLAQHTLEQVEPIRNMFAALFLASIGMLIHVHFLWNHVDILLASVILVVIVKTVVISAVVKGFGYNNKTSLLVGMSLAQIGEFAFVLLSRASNLHLVEGKVYLLLLGTTALSLVTTPLLFKLIPAVMHLGLLLRWFAPDSQNELGYKGDNIRSDSAKQRIALISKDLFT